MTMIELTQRDLSGTTATSSVTLSFELRQRSRLRTQLDDGREAAIVLARGQILRGGECLRSGAGDVVLVHAARELLSQVTSGDSRELARAAYHLGNRHVSVQIGANWLRYAHDHVLDEMLCGLGLVVTCVNEGFEPEAGAYATAHAHGHGHSHDH